MMIAVAGGTTAGSLARTLTLLVMRMGMSVVGGCLEHLEEVVEVVCRWSQDGRTFWKHR
jgi:hypothetical protein